MPQRLAYTSAIALALMTGHAWASDTTVSILPVYQLAEPYILSGFGIIVSALLTWGLAQLQKRTNIRVSDAARATIQMAAVNAAGRVFRAAEGNVANLSVSVGSPLIAAEIPKVTAAVGDAIRELGVTPDGLANLIAGKVGILQASGTATPVSASQPATLSITNPARAQS